MKKLLSLLLACLMVFGATFAFAEETETEEIDLTSLVQRTADLDLTSLTGSLDIASLASDFLGFAVNSDVASQDAGSLMESVTSAIGSLTGGSLENFKTNFLDTIAPAVSSLLSGDSGILSSLSEVKGLVSGLLGGEEGSGLLGAVTGLFGGSSESEDSEGFSASSLLSMIGADSESGLSLENISSIWDTLKDTITSAIQ
ncbi:MAG: hypothetical protein IJ708_00755 [Clostridia bacterium]|nr:hypothetical protein [Clostridia bacterium]